MMMRCLVVCPLLMTDCQSMTFCALETAWSGCRRVQDTILMATLQSQLPVLPVSASIAWGGASFGRLESPPIWGTNWGGIMRGEVQDAILRPDGVH